MLKPAWYQDEQLRFQHDADLHVEVFKDQKETFWVLRDYSKADNFRAFALTVQSSPLSGALDLNQSANEEIKNLTSGVIADAKEISRQTTTWQGKPALRIHASYRYVGGREVYTDPRGQEQSTDERPLEMQWVALLGTLENKSVLITLDASKEHVQKRSPGLEMIVQTLEAQPGDPP